MVMKEVAAETWSPLFGILFLVFDLVYLPNISTKNKLSAGM